MTIVIALSSTRNANRVRLTGWLDVRPDMMRVAGGPLPDGISDRVPSGEFDLTEKPTAAHAEDAAPEEGVVLFPASRASLCDVAA